MNKKQAKEILAEIKKDYKEHCKNQFFCDRCRYSTSSNDKVDCFEKFYIKKLDSLSFANKK